MITKSQILRSSFFFCIGMTLAASYFYRGYTANLKPKMAQQAQNVEIVECSNGSRVFVVNDGILVGRDGDVISSGFELIAQTSLHSDLHIKPLEDLNSHHLIRHPKPLFPRPVKGTVASIASGASSCYFHWMFDILSKLDTLEKSSLSYDKLYVGEIKYPFQKETLEALGIAENKLIAGGYWTQISASTLIVPELPTQHLQIPDFAISFLKNKLLPTTGPQTPKHLFISRKKAPSRHIENEDELIKSISKWNIEPIFMEDHTVKEQAWIAFQADIIICAHGSGLVNILFCKPGTHVLELFPSNISHPSYYKNIAQKIGLRYHSLDCQVNEKGDMVLPTEIINSCYALTNDARSFWSSK